MRIVALLMSFLYIGSLQLKAQKEAIFKIEVASDTVGLDQSFEFSYVLENASGKKINPPNFEGFTVQGPSISTNMSIVNGDVTQSQTYTYYLKPSATGVFTILPATMETKEGSLSSEGKRIVVVEHFEKGVKSRVQNGFQPFNFRDKQPTRPNSQKSKKKYETEEI